MNFSETVVVYDLKLATDDRSDKKFLLTSKLCPLGGCTLLLRGYIHVLNHEKKCIKSDFKEISLKLATNGCVCVCVNSGLTSLSTFFSHITTVSGCDRELNAHFYSAASLKYHVPDTWHDTTPSHIILTLGQPVLALPCKSECQARSS